MLSVTLREVLSMASGCSCFVSQNVFWSLNEVSDASTRFNIRLPKLQGWLVSTQGIKYKTRIFILIMIREM